MNEVFSIAGLASQALSHHFKTSSKSSTRVIDHVSKTSQLKLDPVLSFSSVRFERYSYIFTVITE